MSEFVKKLLKEYDSHESQEEYYNYQEKIIDLIPDLGKELGAGSSGIAYEFFGKVLKVTMNLEDASLAEFIKQRKPKYFSNIFSVDEVFLNDNPTGVYRIIREKLNLLSREEHDILTGFAYITEYDFDGWNDEQFLEYSKVYNPDLVKKLHKEYKQLFFELSKFKMFDLGSNNLGRKKDGTLAAFDAETNISFADSYKKFDKFHVNSFEDENISESVVLKELDDSNAPSLPDTMPNEFSDYMAEATAESMTMETGAIPNSLDENKKIIKVLRQLEEAVNPHDADENGEYLIDKIKEGILPFGFLQALIDYQTSTFGLKQLKREIEKYTISLSILKGFKKAPTYLYRVIKINKGWKSYEPGIYSYTISAKMALNFFENDYLANERSGENVAIIKIKTDPKKVILNIDELLGSKLYSKSLRFYKLNWGNTSHDEKDILYNQPKITRKDLYMLYNKNKWVKL